MSTPTRSLAGAGLIALLAVVFTLPGVGVAQRDRLAPTACTVAPRTAANDAILAAATPVPASFKGSNLSRGESADPETVAQVTAAVQELAGCRMQPKAGNTTGAETGSMLRGDG